MSRTLLNQPLTAAVGLALALLLAPRAAFAETIKVTVIEVAGRRAYVSPGEAQHLRRGDTVFIKRKGYRVIAASDDSALIETGGAKLQVGQRGRAKVDAQQQEQVKRLPQPRSLDAYEGKWAQAVRPAETQTPKHVPLGSGKDNHGSTRLLLSLMGAGRFDFTGNVPTLGRTSLRARVVSEPFENVPFAVEADVAAQMWMAADLADRAGSGSRPPARIYALNARYGDTDALHGILGRLRYAAAGLGTLDGMRVQTPLHDTVTLAAFGGLVPSPLNNAVDLDTSRFGTELTYEDLEAAWRPRVSATAHGSRFRGQLDERRLMLQADAYPDDSYAGGYALLSLFDSGNPWNAPTAEVTSAGAHLGTRVGVFHASARLDMQRPERSLWLASFLPESWLCVAKPAAQSGLPEPCHGDEVRYLAQGQVGLRFDDASLTLGTSVSRTAHVDADQNGGFLNFRMQHLPGNMRADVTLSGSYGSLFRTAAVMLAPGMMLSDEIDISLRYRPAIARYNADTGTFLESTIGASVRVTPSPTLEFGLDSDAIYGRDVRMLFVQLMSTVRL